MSLDLHNYGSRIKQSEKSVKKSKISKKNKELIFKFEDHLFATGISKPRIIKYLDSLKRLALWLNLDFDKAKKEDIMSLVKEIRLKDYSEWTKQGYFVILKRFYRWINGEQSYPEEVSWISTNLSRKKLKLPAEGDLLSEEEVKKVIDYVEHPRNKAFISMLFESGCRIGELANLRLKNVIIDSKGIVLTVFGKTGSRKIRIIGSTPYLMNWLSIHPLRNDKEAPLWIRICIGKKTRDSFLSYRAIVKVIKESFKGAGINKRVYPHLFRHSRATIMASHLTEFQMNQYFGWIQGSKMASTYVHLSGRDLDNALLEFNGMEVSKNVK